MKNQELPDPNRFKGINIDQYCRSVESLLNCIHSKSRNKKALISEELTDHFDNDEFDLALDTTLFTE